MSCSSPSLESALRHCPFLKAIVNQEGLEFARRVATNPTLPAHEKGVFRPIFEEEHDFCATFRLFHGPQGVMPLPLSTGTPKAAPESVAMSRQEEQFRTAPTVGGPSTSSQLVIAAQQHGLPARVGHLPLASMSLPFFGNGPDFSKFFLQRRKPPSGNHGPEKPSSSPSSNAGSSSNGPKPSQDRQPRPAKGSGRGGAIRTGAASAYGSASTSSPGALPVGGGCPLRKALGPFAGLIFNASGKIACPEPIMAARTMLSRTAPVRSLRPQALGVKLLAVGAAATTLNIPAGAWREHMRKFSFGWFVAVHATIPFIAMLRKAVLMPPAAIAFTIGAAILGQAIGARLERKRLLHERQQAAVTAEPSVLAPAAVVPAAGSRKRRIRGLVRKLTQRNSNEACAVAAAAVQVRVCPTLSSRGVLVTAA